MRFEERFQLLIESGQATERSVAAARRALAEVETRYGAQLDGELGAPLALHLAITLKRLLRGETLSQVPGPVWQELEDYPEELAFAATLAALIEGTLDLSLPRDEIGFIAVHLCRIRLESGSARVREIGPGPGRQPGQDG